MLAGSVILAFVLVSVSSGAQSTDTTNRIRHILMDWPVGKKRPEQATNSLNTTGNVDVESSRREISFQLQSIRSQVSSSSRASCRKDVAIAVAALESDWSRMSIERFQCEANCSSQLEALRRFQNELDVFGETIADCAQAAENRLWWMKQESGFGFGVYSQFENQSNINHLGADDRRSGTELALGGLIDGVLRTDSSWHSTSTDLSYEIPSISIKGIQWDHFQEHGLSTEDVGEYKIGFEWGRDHRWFEGFSSPDRIQLRDLAFTGGGRWMLSPGRALEVSSLWSSVKWFQISNSIVGNSPIWNHRRVGVEIRYPLLAGFDYGTWIVLEWDQHTFADINEQPMVRALLMAYEAEKRFSFGENIRVRLGLRDWRTAATGAGLWPEGGLSVRTRSSSHPDFSFFQRFMFEPTQNPWSSYSMKLGYQSEAMWEKYDWTVSFITEGARVRHRALPGETRNDTFLTVNLKPSYKFASHWRVSAALTYEWWWIPAGRTVSSAVPYMRDTAQNFSVLGRVQYEF